MSLDHSGLETQDLRVIDAEALSGPSAHALIISRERSPVTSCFS
jgi:hypothetical protein